MKIFQAHVLWTAAESAEAVFGALYSAGFMLLWLCCWPLYRLYRSHSLRG